MDYPVYATEDKGYIVVRCVIGLSFHFAVFSETLFRFAISRKGDNLYTE